MKRFTTWLVSGLLAASLAGTAQANELCDDIDYLLRKARSDFSSSTIRGAQEQFGDYYAKRGLSGAKSCLIDEDKESAGYSCIWEFPKGDGSVESAYEELTGKVRECLFGKISRIREKPMFGGRGYGTYFDIAGPDKPRRGRITVGVRISDYLKYRKLTFQIDRWKR